MRTLSTHVALSFHFKCCPIFTDDTASVSCAFVEMRYAANAAALVRMSRKLQICGSYVPVAYATAKRYEGGVAADGDDNAHINKNSTAAATASGFNPRRLFLMRLPEAPSLDQRIREAAERYGRVEDLKLLG